MTQKRILLIHEDRLLGSLYREKLESAGLTVDSASTAEAGLQGARERRPDAVVDPVLPGVDLRALVTELRSLGGAKQPPVFALPTSRLLLAEAAQEAGAQILSRGVNPVAEVIDAVQTALGLEKTAALVKGLVFRPDESLLKASLGTAPEALMTLRRALHEASREKGDPSALPEFFQRCHGLAEQMALLGERPLYALTAQLEALAFELSKFPEQINPSVLRTLGQAVDFLSTLLPDATRNRLRDPATAQVLVVDDEDGARKIIMAAMRLANLKSMAADTPTTALAALGVEAFDLIFLDVGLPEMTGFDLCTKIRALPMHEKTPVVFITGMATFHHRVQSSLSGGSDFVGKPFSLPELGLKALIWTFKGQLGQV